MGILSNDDKIKKSSKPIEQYCTGWKFPSPLESQKENVWRLVLILPTF